MTLEDIRNKIDEIDEQILWLLERRMELSLLTRSLKKQIDDDERERKIKKKLLSFHLQCLTPPFLEKLYSVILNESKRLQKKKSTVIGFQGEHGAYSEAAVQKAGIGIAIPFPDFGSLFEAAERGMIEKIIVPVENFSAGSINETNYLLLSTSLKIELEITMKISHALLAPPGTRREDIKYVFSHPQALAQCRNYLFSRGLEARPFYDTAGAARMVALQRPRSSAAIASELCAKIYGLEVVEREIEDNPLNQTRFFLLSTQGAKKGSKASFIFSIPDRPGSLKEILQIFAEKSLNVSRIQSVPVMEKERKYYFFIDLEIDGKTKEGKLAISKVKDKASYFKFLGYYSTMEVAP